MVTRMNPETISVDIFALPSPNPIPNNANIYYQYVVDPVASTTVSSALSTNTVNTTVNTATLSAATKTVDKTFADVGNILTYTVTLTNTGNVTANNVIITDTIPNDTTFVTSSVIINNVANSSTVPVGNVLIINVGNIAPNATATLVFKVTVNTIPNPNPIPNTANAGFTYTSNPSIPNGQSSSTNTNTVNTQVNNANLSNNSKGVDKAFTTVGDTLTYTITISNSGNTNANSVVFKDTIPNGTTFVTNSVLVNGVTQTGQSVAPPSGLSLGTISAGSIVTISFKVLVNTIPSPNPIPNSGVITYNYIVDTILGTINAGTLVTNIVSTTINEAIINSTKSVSSNNVVAGDIITYTVNLGNSGNATANNVVFIDTIPNGTTFVSNSLTLNGVTQAGQSPAPPSGFNIGSIAPNGSASITFKVLVNTVPSPNPIPNASTTSYNYLFNTTTGATLPGGSTSNTVTTYVNPSITPVKTVDKQYATVGDTLTYTLVWQNALNVSQTNVKLFDTIPNNTTFVANSINVNGTNVPGATITPPSGLSLGTLSPGSRTTVTFNVVVNTIPSPNPIPNQGIAQYSFVTDTVLGTVTTETAASNIVNTQVNTASISSTVKTVSKSYAKVGDILTYTISFGNIGNTSATNVTLIDTIPNGTTFVTNSVFVDNVNRPGEVVSLPTGLNIGTLGVGQYTTISFKVLVNTVPSPNPIPNSGFVSFNYTIDPVTIRTAPGFINTNTVTTQINYATLGLSSKYVDKVYANVGDTLTYTITYVNTGNVTANNVVVLDTIPNDTSFVSQSVVINNVSNTSTVPTGNVLAVSLGNIAPNGTATLVFKVKVNTIPNPNPIPNSAYASFTYTSNPSIPNGESSSGSTNTVSTQVNNANLGNIVKGVDKAFAIIGDVLTYTITIPNSGNTSANNVSFIDTIPNGTTFIANSVMINGITQNGALVAPPSGLSVGTIGPNSFVTISFKVTVNTIPSPNPIPNSGTTNYSYIVNSVLGTTVGGSNNTNIVSTTINEAVINSTKSVSASNVVVGNVITYTINLSNSGNATANNVVFIDTIPSGTTFVSNSLTLNGVTQPGQSPAPPTGFNVGSIAPNGSVSITFKVTVDTVPTPNPIPNASTTSYNYLSNTTTGATLPGGSTSNTVSTYVNPTSNPLKTVDKQYATVGDTLTYTLVWKNVLNVSQFNVKLLDTIPNDTTFVSNSITINGTTSPGSTISPPTGLSLGTLPAGSITTVTFNVVVNTIPNPNPIPNQGIAQYSFISDPTLGATTTETVASNIVNTQVNTASISSTVKSVSKSYAKVGDILTYTISFGNIGNTSATNVTLVDTIPNGTTFVVNSVYVNNVNQPGAVVYPPSGLNVGTLGAGQYATISFQVLVTTVPNPNPIPNSGFVSFNYTIDPITSKTAPGFINTNTVTTQINYATLGLSSKSVDKVNANVGDVLTYTITYTNTGNVTANNVVVVDTIPNDTRFVSQSVIINNTPNTSTVPTGNALRVSLGNIAPNATATLVFKVTVNTIPNPNPIPNSANGSFTYTSNPSIPNGESSSSNTNTVNTQINNANLGNVVKGVDKAFSKIGDILTYTITIPNSGNVSANNVTFIDTIPNGTTFVGNSVMINGVTQSGSSVAPPSGLNIGTIGPNSFATISFKVLVNTIPSPNPIPNSATTNYIYTVDPILGTTASGSKNTNIVTTTINEAVINSTKTVSATNVIVGNVITYTINLGNSGNATANNVVFIDTIPNGTTFVSNSLTLNGVTQPGQSPAPPSGFNIGSIAPNGSVSITFKVLVNNVPTPNPIPNASTTSYDYLFNTTTGATLPGGSTSNTVNTYVNQSITPVKSVDKQYATVGETLTYTLVWKNALNVSQTNVKLFDTIPNDTTFVANSIYINGINIGGATINPPSGLSLGTLLPGSTTTVTFNVTVNTIPNPNPIPNQGIMQYSFVTDTVLGTVTTETVGSNIVNTQVNTASISKSVKSVDKVYAKVGDVLTYTISFGNIGNTSANNVILIDTIPNGTSFVTNSVFVDNVNQPGAVVSLPTGLNLGTLGVGQYTTISFQVTVTTLPNPNPIPNSGFISFNYTIDPVTIRTAPGFINTNTVTTQINYATLSLASKSVDKVNANVGDTLTYTITYVNTGNVTANNVVIVDTIPNDTSFVSQSVVINNTPNTSTVPTGNALIVSLGNIVPNGTATLVFKVSVNTIPNPNPIPNSTFASYTYTSNPSIPNGESSSGTTNTVNTQVNNANLENIVKGVDKAFAKIGDVLTYTITIPNSGNVSANNVAFIDTIPNGTTFIANSVIINGVTQNGFIVDPPSGVNIGTIGPNSFATISFKVTVNTIPSPNPIPNSGTTNYIYTVDPILGTTAQGSKNTNIVTTTINQAVINSSKKVSLSNVIVGDQITYTINLSNSGNATANNVVFIDTIPNGTTFVSDSLTLNGVSQSGKSPAPPSGFSVGSIAPNGSVSITFKVTIDTIPNPNPIPNASTTSYNYLFDTTTGETLPGGSTSNTVSTYVNPNSNPLKIVDKRYATVGEILTYTVVWRNVLNVEETDVILIDTIPNDTTFVSNSITVNGTTVSGATINPPAGLNVGTLPIGGIATVTFKVKVDTVPNPNPIPNQVLAQYTYISDPTLGVVSTATAPSNIVETQVSIASIPTVNKAVDKQFAIVGDTITYTISFTNVGNTIANNVTFIDTIPNGTTFLINSVTVNGSNVPGGVVAPPSGLSIGDVQVGATVTLSFQVIVNTIPNPNPIPNSGYVNYSYVVDPIISSTIPGSTNTNTVNTQVNQANFGISGKTVNKSYANIGDTLVYNIVYRNTGNVTANNMVIVDTIPNGTTFVSQSVVVNNIPNTSTVPVGNVLRISMGNIGPNTTATLTFSVLVVSIPNPNPIPNTASGSYTYTLDPAIPNGNSGSNDTNTTNTQVNNANLSGISKFVDKLFATCGDIITYTVSIPNSGNITATNVILSDTVPVGTVFVANSIIVNGVSSSATSPTNLPVGSIPPGATTTISFKVQVVC